MYGRLARFILGTIVSAVALVAFGAMLVGSTIAADRYGSRVGTACFLGCLSVLGGAVYTIWTERPNHLR